MLIFLQWLTATFNDDSQHVLVAKTCNYLKFNMQNKLTLNGIAEKMGTNRNKLSESFKQVLGIGVFEYLRGERLQKAKYLLSNTNERVHSIANEVGYCECSYFSTAYRNKFGVSPAKDRLSFRGK